MTSARAVSARPSSPAAKSSFDQYVTARSGMLLRFAYLLCGDRHLAEDLVQEVLVRAHRRWPAVEAGNPDAYLKQALVRAHISWRRRRASREVATATVRDVAVLATFDDAHASREEVWALLAMLPPKQRAVLVLRYFEDLDDRRIAELVGSSAGAVRVSAHRGLTALRETLTQRASQVSEKPQLAQAVRRGAARDARARAVGTAGAAVVAVAALLGLVVALMRPGGDAPAPVQPSPSGGLTPTTTPGPTLGALVPRSVPAASFPYELSYVPNGLSLRSVSSYGSGERILYYDGFNVTLFATGEEPSPAPGTVTSTTVNGHPATLSVEENDINQEFIRLSWQQDGRWLRVISGRGHVEDAEGPVADDVIRIAEGLRTGTTVDTLTPAVVSVALPAGYEFDYWERTFVCAKPAPATTHFCVSAGYSEVNTGIGNGNFLPNMTVDGMQAQLGEPSDSEGNGYLQLIVRRTDGLYVVVGNPSSLGLTADDLVAIYRGTTIAT